MFDPTTGYRYDVWTAENSATPRYEGVGFGNNYNAGFGDPDILSLTAKTYGMGIQPGAPMAPTGPDIFNTYNGTPGGGRFAVGRRTVGQQNGMMMILLWLVIGAALGWFGRGMWETRGRRA